MEREVQGERGRDRAGERRRDGQTDRQTDRQTEMGRDRGRRETEGGKRSNQIHRTLTSARTALLPL